MIPPSNAFKCLSCGKCCKWPGAVKVNASEIDAIAEYLNISSASFIESHTRFMPDRSGLSLNEKEDGSCEFLTADNLCLINAVKPDQCRRFPHYWRFPGWDEVCEGGKAAKKK